LLHDTASHYLSGKLEGVRLPVCRYLGGHRTTPAQQRELLERDGAVACLAAMPRNPLYRAGVVALARAVAASRADHLLLLQNPDCPPLGALPGRVTARCLMAVLPRLERLARPTYCRFARWPRFAGSREAVWSAIVAQNYGATHMLLPDIAADDPQAAPAHRSRQSEELLEAARRELAIRLVGAGPGASMAGGQIRTVIEAGGEAALRACFSEEIEILETHHRRGSARGFALLLTGLSGAGKSSLAHALADRLERGFGRAVTVLDGDYSRYLLASDLTGVREDHRRNVARHALVAAEIVRHGGTVICALVAPEAAARADARAAVECNGRFIEIYLAASAATCRERDQKGIYARGRAGLLGIAPPALGDGYEVPEHPEIIADSANHGVEELTAQVIEYLIAQRLVESPANRSPA
jgi:sulfate adenylyltransferase